MPTDLKRIMVSLDPETEDYINDYARREKRSLANTCLVLIDEAIKARLKQEGIEEGPGEPMPSLDEVNRIFKEEG